MFNSTSSQEPIATTVHAADSEPFGEATHKTIFLTLVALAAAILLFVPLVVIAVLIKLTSRGPVLYWSKRVGQQNQLFSVPKFRTMRLKTPTVRNVTTHLLTNLDQYLTPIGPFFRRSSLDELPQLWSIWVGDMSWVGPRPALFNQDDLITLRTQAGVDLLKQGHKAVGFMY